MRVLHFVARFSLPPETFIYDLICNLNSAEGFEQLVLCHSRHNEEERPFDPVICFGKKRSFLERVCNKLFFKDYTNVEATAIRNTIANFGPDVIHAHFGVNGVSIGKLLSKWGISVPLLIHCHGTDVIWIPVKDQRYKRDIMNLASMGSVFFASNTLYLKGVMTKLGIPKSKISLVRNAVKVINLGSHSRHPVGGESVIRLVAVGRLIRWKGHAYLFEALAQLNKLSRQEFRLTLYGDGDERDSLKQLASKLDIAGLIDFRGSVAHEKLLNEIGNFDILVQSSIVDPETGQCESFGVSILEAIANGLPVVVTNTGGMPELLGSEHPWARIVDPVSAESIANSILSVCGTKWSSEEHREFIADRLSVYSSEEQKNDLLTAYQRAIKKSF